MGMPTICQWVCWPIMNMGRCENTPSVTSRLLAQKASGFWKSVGRGMRVGSVGG